MNKEKINPFTLDLPLRFTEADVEVVTDLGCVYLCRMEKTLGTQKIKAYTVISKKTKESLKLKTFFSDKASNNGGKSLLLEDFITSPSSRNQQENYFILRFERSRDIWCYNSDGEVLFKASGGHGPVNIAVKFCDRNLIVTKTTNSFEMYRYYAPVKEGKLDLYSKLCDIYGDLDEKTIKPRELDGEVQICVHYYKAGMPKLDYYIVSDDLSLKKIKVEEKERVEA